MNIFDKRKALLQEKFSKVLSEAYDDYGDDEEDPFEPDHFSSLPENDPSDHHYGGDPDGQEKHFRSKVENHDTKRKHHKDIIKSMKSFSSVNDVHGDIKDQWDTIYQHHVDSAEDDPDHDFNKKVLKNIDAGKKRSLSESFITESPEEHKDLFALLHKHYDSYSPKHKKHVDEILNHFGKKIYGGEEEKPQPQPKPKPKNVIQKYVNRDETGNKYGKNVYRESAGEDDDDFEPEKEEDVEKNNHKLRDIKRRFEQTGKLSTKDQKTLEASKRSRRPKLYESRTALRLHHLLGVDNNEENDRLEETHKQRAKDYQELLGWHDPHGLHYATATADHSANKFARTLQEHHDIKPGDIQDVKHVAGGIKSLSDYAREKGLLKNTNEKLESLAHPHDVAVSTKPDKNGKQKVIGASLKAGGRGIANANLDEFHNLLNDPKAGGTEGLSKIVDIAKKHEQEGNKLAKKHFSDFKITDKNGKELNPDHKDYDTHRKAALNEIKNRVNSLPKDNEKRIAAENDFKKLGRESSYELNKHFSDMFNGRSPEDKKHILNHLTKQNYHEDLPYHMVASDEIYPKDVDNSDGKYTDEHLFDHTQDHPYFKENKSKFDLTPSPEWKDDLVGKQVNGASDHHMRLTGHGRSGSFGLDVHNSDSGIPFLSYGLGQGAYSNHTTNTKYEFNSQIFNHEKDVAKRKENIQKLKEDNHDNFRDGTIDGRNLTKAGDLWSLHKTRFKDKENIQDTEWTGKDKSQVHQPIGVIPGMAQVHDQGYNGINIGPHQHDEGLDPYGNRRHNALSNAYVNAHNESKESYKDIQKSHDAAYEHADYPGKTKEKFQEFLNAPEHQGDAPLSRKTKNQFGNKEQRNSLSYLKSATREAYDAHDAASKHHDSNKNGDDFNTRPSANANKKTMKHDDAIKSVANAYSEWHKWHDEKPKEEPNQTVPRVKKEAEPKPKKQDSMEAAENHMNKADEHSSIDVHSHIKSHPDYNEEKHGKLYNRWKNLEGAAGRIEDVKKAHADAADAHTDALDHHTDDSVNNARKEEASKKANQATKSADTAARTAGDTFAGWAKNMTDRGIHESLSTSESRKTFNVVQRFFGKKIV